jgi:rhodanese-related sulfurtransferase
MADAVNRNEVQTLAHNGSLVLEVLDAKQYESAHIRGAVNLPLARLNRESASGLAQDRMVILYCYDFQ